MILYLYKCMLRFYSIELCLQYNIFNSVVTRGCKVGDCPPCLGGQHHVMFDQIILLQHNPVIFQIKNKTESKIRISSSK